MKATLIALFLALAAFSASAGDRKASKVMEEIQAILHDESAAVPSSLTIGQMESLQERLSVPLQEQAYIVKSAVASLMIPGMGEMLNGDYLGGTLLLTSDVALFAGTIVAAYFLLPSQLQFGSLDYLTTPFSDIHAAWKSALQSMTFTQALPMLGVMAGSTILRAVLSGVSSHNARKLAEKRIESGAVTFEPRLFLAKLGGPMGIGMGFGLKY
jgi:hypothetical protein